MRAPVLAGLLIRCLVIAVLLLSACGTDEHSDDEGSDNAVCTDMVGQTMPPDFDGCEIADDEYVDATVVECSDGRVFVMVASLEAPLAGIYGFVGKPMKAVMGDGKEYRAMLGCREF